MRSRISIIVVFMAIVFSACEKDMSEETGQLPGGGGIIVNQGGGTGTVNNTGCKDCMYYPVCSPSVYKYSKGLPRTVAGITYSDVIHVHEQTTVDLAGTTIPAGQSEYYYAKGIGLIESISTDDFSGSQILHHVLISATIP